jgi:carboxymethylenebutenolidase
MNTETILLTVAGAGEMQAHVARPAEASKRGVIVVQEAFGVTDYIRRIAQRFAGQGFLAIAPEFFHRSAPAGTELSYTDYPSVAPHIQALTIEGQEADLKAAFDWLVSQGIAENKIAVLGFCMGGRASFIANATLPIAGAVSFYGGGIAQGLLDRAKDLHAPQMLLWGGKDAHILPEHRRAVADALIAAGKPYIDVTFGEADHAFARDVGEHYDEQSTNEAWALVDAFLAENL